MDSSHWKFGKGCNGLNCMKNRTFIRGRCLKRNVSNPFSSGCVRPLRQTDQFKASPLHARSESVTPGCVQRLAWRVYACSASILFVIIARLSWHDRQCSVRELKIKRDPWNWLIQFQGSFASMARARNVLCARSREFSVVSIRIALQSGSTPSDCSCIPKVYL